MENPQTFLLQAGVRAQVNSVLHSTATLNKNQSLLENSKLRRKKIREQPKLATRLRYVEKLAQEIRILLGNNQTPEYYARGRRRGSANYH